MKKLFLLLTFALFALFAGNQVSAQTKTNVQISTFADSFTFIHYVTYPTKDTLTTHRYHWKLVKPLQFYRYGYLLYVTDAATPANKFTLNLKKDSVTTGSSTAFANVKGDYGAAACGAFLESINQLTYKNYSSAVTTVAAIKASRGFLHVISIDSVGVGGKGTATIWDAATTADTGSTNTPLFSGPITALRTIQKDVQFTKGLVIKQKTTTAGRINVSYYFVEPENEFDTY